MELLKEKELSESHTKTRPKTLANLKTRRFDAPKTEVGCYGLQRKRTERGLPSAEEVLFRRRESYPTPKREEEIKDFEMQ